MLKSGRLRALAVTSAKRSQSMPEVPAVSEVLPGYDATTGVYGILVPAKTPRAAIAKLENAIAEVSKNPAYRDVMYVEELIGPEMVNTMPPETVTAFRDHGRVERTLDRNVDDASRTFESLSEAGIDYDDVVATLEREGVEKFADSFAELLNGVKVKLQGAMAR